MADMYQEQVNYQDHLQLDKILNAQDRLSTHPEEYLFIIIHQIYELWFKTLLIDLERVVAHLENDELAQAIWLLRRAGRIMEVADKQLDVLTMLTPGDFQEFRPSLKESSGLQSRQFRKLEVLGGLCETAGENYARRVEAQWPGLQAEVKTTLHQALMALLDRYGVSLAEIYQKRWQHYNLFSLCEGCIEFDSKFVTWRQNHVKMVERMIGGRARGTGGAGVPYLTHTTVYRFFPELWEARNALTEGAGGYVYEE
ncbi:MAG: hypothetical protein HYR94_15685 [Chloroflexi bacterium]|nr:hypothetical protein [Chloroflexota bacterium]